MSADATPLVPPILMRDVAIPCVYIAGPYTAADALSVERNVRRAEDLAYEVARIGAMPVCPHTNLRFASREIATFLYPATLELMRRCDAVIFVHGWQFSDGARGEHREAERLGMPMFFGLQALCSWVESRPVLRMRQP